MNRIVLESEIKWQDMILNSEKNDIAKFENKGKLGNLKKAQ